MQSNQLLSDRSHPGNQQLKLGIEEILTKNTHANINIYHITIINSI